MDLDAIGLGPGDEVGVLGARVQSGCHDCVGYCFFRLLGLLMCVIPVWLRITFVQ